MLLIDLVVVILLFLLFVQTTNIRKKCKVVTQNHANEKKSKKNMSLHNKNKGIFVFNNSNLCASKSTRPLTSFNFPLTSLNSQKLSH